MRYKKNTCVNLAYKEKYIYRVKPHSESGLESEFLHSNGLLGCHFAVNTKY